MIRIVPRFIEFISEEKKDWQGPGMHYKAGAGILPICKFSGRVFLLFKDYQEGDPDSNMWVMPGGMMEENELEMNIDMGSRKAALREFKEETGISDPFDEIIESYVYKSPNGGFNYYNFIGLVEEEFTPKISHEHSDGKWFAVAALRAIPREMFHFGLKLLFENDEKTILQYAK